jgi:hypothetical protein
MRRIALVIVLILAAGSWPTAGAFAGGSTSTQPTASNRLQADFN